MEFKTYINGKGMSLNELSKKTGIPYTTIKTYSQKNSFMTATLINASKIADALGVTLDQLVKDLKPHE